MTAGDDPTSAGRRRLALVDAAVVLWAAIWLAVGILVGIEVHDLDRLSTTLVKAGGTLQTTGSALTALSHVPLVGGMVSHLAGQVSSTASTTVSDAAATKSTVDTLAYLLAIVVVVLPSVPVVAAYLPYRRRRARDIRAVRAALVSPTERPRVERYLAERALREMSYDELRRVTADPWGDVAAGRVTAVAAAELARMGLPAAARGESNEQPP